MQALLVDRERDDPMRRLRSAVARCMAVLIVFATLLVSPAARAEEPSPLPYRADLNVGLGWIQRATSNDPTKNRTGGSYDTAFGQSVQVRATVASWLRIGVYYQRGYHTLNIPQGALAPPGAIIELDPLLAYTLGGRLEPTIVLTPRLRLWLVLGAGWGRITSAKMTVSTPTRSYKVGEREGVMVEYPMGFGASFQIIPGWLAITTDTTYAPHAAQSGSLFEHTQYVDSNGNLQHTLPLPVPESSFTQMFGLSLIR